MRGAAHRRSFSLRAPRRLSILLLATALVLPGAAVARSKIDAPSTPILSLTRADQTSLTISWGASVGPQKIIGYRLSLDGSLFGWTTSFLKTFSGLKCGTTHNVQVDAVDAASAFSGKGDLNASTAACAASGNPPPSGPEKVPPPQSGKPDPPKPGKGDDSGTSLYLAVKGSDKGKCTQSAPCASFDRAYRLAAPGQTVQLAAGSYPSQVIKADSSKATAKANVVFRPAPSAEVRIRGVRIAGSHLELRDMQFSWYVEAAANGVTFRNVKADGPVHIKGASNVSVLGGEVYSPVPIKDDSQISSKDGKVPTNILIDGVSFHDFQDVGPGNKNHIECLQVGAAINLTIRNSTFRNCATHDIFIRSWGNVNNSPHPLSNIVIENNWLAKTTVGFYALSVQDDLWKGTPRTSAFILNNTAQQSIVVRVWHGTAQVRGNYLPSMTAYFCNSYGQKAWFDYNTYASGVPCGPHDRVAGG